MIANINLISSQKSLPWSKIYRDVDKGVNFDFLWSN